MIQRSKNRALFESLMGTAHYHLSAILCPELQLLWRAGVRLLERISGPPSADGGSASGTATRRPSHPLVNPYSPGKTRPARQHSPQAEIVSKDMKFNRINETGESESDSSSMFSNGAYIQLGLENNLTMLRQSQ
jgi:hypothetical protein